MIKDLREAKEVGELYNSDHMHEHFSLKSVAFVVFLSRNADLNWSDHPP